MDNHLNAARVHLTLACLYGLMAAFALFVFGVTLTEHGPDSSRDVALVVLAFMAGLASMHYLVSRGARQAKPWANVLSIIIAILLLFGFPIGTAIGVYLLVNGNWRAPEAGAEAT